MPPRVLIADDHGVVREGLRATLQARDACEVVGEVSTGLEAAELAAKLSPDIVIMDIRMPDLNGIEATRMIRRKAPDAKVIALSAHQDSRSVVEMLKAGASGYVLKGSCVAEVVTAIEIVSQGGTYLSPPVAETVVQEFVRRGSDGVKSVWNTLVPRERQVLQMLAEGLSTKAIARRLRFSERTIDRHRSALMSKLGVGSIAELTRYAIREGIVPLE